MSSAPSSSTLKAAFAYAPGDVIAGKYALEELLGSGGMGAVFKAKNTLLDMPVAIKLIRADLDREVLSGRLLQEARAAAKLAHAAIVRVFDIGRTALGDPFIVMELLQGENLGQLLEREGRLSSARAVKLLLPIADALSVVSGKGLVHRDVKPDNIFIAYGEEGELQPKLVDFGIVKQEQAGGESESNQADSLVGSPDYMSPEQARGVEGLDQRSDVWSFSVVLYESIAGVTPFESKTYNGLLRLIVETEPVSLLEHAAADAALSAIVSKGMSKDPSARYGSLGQMGRALASWLYEQGFSEDACGVSLETRWLSRSTDPNAFGRVTRSSSPDSWPAPPSGVRIVNAGATAAPSSEVRDLNVDSGQYHPLSRAPRNGTPLSLAQTSAGVPAKQRSRYLLGAATLVVAALAVAWFGLGRAMVEAPSSRSPSVLSTSPLVEARPTPPAGAVASRTLEEPEMAPDSAQPREAAPVPIGSVEPVDPASAESAKLNPRAPQKTRVVARPAQRRSDLLAPY